MPDGFVPPSIRAPHRCEDCRHQIEGTHYWRAGKRFCGGCVTRHPLPLKVISPPEPVPWLRALARLSKREWFERFGSGR